MRLHGTALPQSKLTPELVAEIRKIANPEKTRQGKYTLSAKQWAKKLGVHYGTIQAVRNMTTWFHIS